MIIPNLYEKLGLNLQEVAYNYIEIWFKFVVIPPSQCTSMFPQTWYALHAQAHFKVRASFSSFCRDCPSVLTGCFSPYLSFTRLTLIRVLTAVVWRQGVHSDACFASWKHYDPVIDESLCAFTERGRVYLHSASSSRWSTERRAALREVEPHTERQVRSNL